MSVHRTLAGDWAECEDSACTLKFHLPDLTVAEAEALPLAALMPLFEAIDPPYQVTPTGEKRWYDHGYMLHRDYDLPARIGRDLHSWYQHGQRHREHGRPARIWTDGLQQFFLHDKMYGESRDGVFHDWADTTSPSPQHALRPERKRRHLANWWQDFRLKHGLP